MPQESPAQNNLRGGGGGGFIKRTLTLQVTLQVGPCEVLRQLCTLQRLTDCCAGTRTHGKKLPLPADSTSGTRHCTPCRRLSFA